MSASKRETALKSLDIRHLLGDDGNLLRLIVLLIATFAALSLARPTIFPTVKTFQSMSVQFPEIGILAIAMMITMLTGGIDLSVVSTANLAAVLASIMLTNIVPPDGTGAAVWLGIGLAILVALLVGLLAGLFNGILIAIVGITPILATLGTWIMYQGFSIVITGGTSFFAVPQFLFIGNANVWIFPVPLIIFAIAAIIFSIILNRTTFGYKVYMLGSNAKAALFSGIDNQRVLIKTYALAGMLAASAGIIFLARSNSAKADYGESYVLLVVLIAILGGVDYMGGFGKISGVVLAVLILQMLSTGLNMLLFMYSGSNFFKEFAWGLVLLLVMVVNHFINVRRQRASVILSEYDSSA